MLSRDFPLDTKSISKLSKQGLLLDNAKTQLDDELDYVLELWYSQGLHVIKKNDRLHFVTKFTTIDDAEFCIVDIETNGPKIEKHQIIEIAGIKVKNNKIIDKFESLIHCNEIGEFVTKVTGITTDMTKNAPSLKNVLYKFKTFLGDSIFIAHDVKFDYYFISDSFVKIGLEPLLNRSICSLKLAQKTLLADRFSLSFLNQKFNLYPDATHHRAMSDVLTTYELFKLSLQNIKENTTDIQNVEDLIRFVNSGGQRGIRTLGTVASTLP